jgi:hypothetical protein
VIHCSAGLLPGLSVTVLAGVFKIIPCISRAPFCEEGLRVSYGALYRPVTGKPVVMEVHGSDGAAQLRRV